MVRSKINMTRSTIFSWKWTLIGPIIGKLPPLIISPYVSIYDKMEFTLNHIIISPLRLFIKIAIPQGINDVKSW